MKEQKNITINTRRLGVDDVFFCFKDAEKYINNDVFDKASVVYCIIGVKERNSDKKDLFTKYAEKISVLTEEDFEKNLTTSLKNRYAIKSEIIAITGTKGKTSSCWFSAQLLSNNGISCGYIGTLGVYFFDKNGKKTKISTDNSSSLTTPDIDELYSSASELSKLGADFIVFEASSHSLSQKRIEGLPIKCGCFTNLSQDHLDYHKTMDEYFTAKTTLFSRYLSKDGIAVINKDDERFEQLQNICLNNGLKIYTFGKKQADFNILSITQDNTFQKIIFGFQGKEFSFSTEIIGDFQVYNIILAIAISNIKGGIPLAKLCKDAEKITAPIGRMQKIRHKQTTKADFIVDFAHTPKSLEESLLCLRKVYKSIVVVFGCGGNRDKQKRPIMFEIAKKLANIVVITTDNQREEVPELIIEDILCYERQARDNPLVSDEFVINEISKIDERYKGFSCDKFFAITDRKEAIKFAVNEYKNIENSVILVAGKGHENYQIIGKEKIHFSDEEEILRNLS